MPSPRHLVSRVVLTALAGLALLGASPAALDPSNVLVVYQSTIGEESDGKIISDYYLRKRPGVWTMNLAEYGLPLPFYGGTVSYADFAARIREPIRQFLAGNGLEEQIRVIVLTKGVPHRIQQMAPGAENVGDTPKAAQDLVENRNASYASVDSELTLLWQDLERGEAGEPLDSHADNFVENPYYKSTRPITEFVSQGIADQSTTSFGAEHSEDVEFWSLKGDAGGIVLTSRLDGNSVEDVLAMIDRAQDVRFDIHQDLLVLDASPAEFDGKDLSQVDDHFRQAWQARRFNDDKTFALGASPGSFQGASNLATLRIEGPIALLSGYGVNHGGENETGWLSTYQGQFTNGAIFNTWESFNGRQFGGHGGYVSGSGEHAQLADFIAYGGTFGLGHAWEPFSFSVGRNHILLENFMVNGLTWVESAWSSLVALSWQNLVLGDPLAKASVNLQPLISLSGSLATLEHYGGTQQFKLTMNRAVDKSTTVRLRFHGAELGRDYQASGYVNSNGEMSLILPPGKTQKLIRIRVLDDMTQEGLEQLKMELLPSADNDGDGFGDQYSFLAPQEALLAIAETAFDLWRNRYFGKDALTEGQPGEDPDEDELTNLEEYAFGRDPHRPETDPVLSEVVEGVTSHWVLDLPKTLPRDISLSLLASEQGQPDKASIVGKKIGQQAWRGSAALTRDFSSPTIERYRISGPSVAGKALQVQVSAIPNP